ncbi:ABC transporter substrate-binding protein [Mangrovactinospora gilvigrisea]|uniref:ABC transporter substrate-binding protein n=1 Tax=Mangrovactinospora gilvigrisea TaxID=1428644 RepID=A0A1J7CAZ3_9ACTN|nr:ABC transporter substrate-binding protein [Mangrovactinospora gilvigrisea]
MQLNRRRFVALGAAALAAPALAACGSGGSGSAKAQKGGTLYILLNSPELDDPATSQSLGISIIHLLHRSLTTWDTSGGGQPKVIPDLATDTGTPSDGGKTWTYKLKPGLKFSNGQVIKAADVKYALERSFDPALSQGLGYHKTLLAGGDKYKGPYQGKQLDSIEVQGDDTLVFHLNRPYGDWPWIASMPAFAPVPKASDPNPHTYVNHQVTSGPYVLTQYQKNKQGVLIRNKHWDKKTAAPGTGKADKIVISLNLNPDVINQRLISDSGNDQYAYTNGASVSAALLPKVNGNPTAKSRMVVSPSGALAYLVMNNRKKPLDQLKVRQAINYAIDKQAYQVASGGSVIGGNIATTLIEPGLNGYQKYDPWNAPVNGDVAKAKALLKSAGVSGLKLTLIADSSGSGVEAKTQAIQESLRRVGITVTIKMMDENSYYDTITNGKGDYDLHISSWLADFPSALGAIQPLFASDQIGNGNFNTALYSNPAVDKLINAAMGETDAAKAAAAWTAIDKRIQQDAPVVPLIYSKNAYMHGSKVAGFTIGQFPPYPNTLTVGTAG